MNKDTFKLKKRNYSDKHFKGSIVDAEQLIEALDDEILAGVGREIERREELIKDKKHLLFEQKNLEALTSFVRITSSRIR